MGADWVWHRVEDVREDVLACWGHADLVIAGWECQGLSRVGEGKGMELIRILKMIKRKQGEVAYIVENVDIRDDMRGGVALDAAQNGSRTHRTRRYWQNVVPEAVVQYELSMMERPRARLVQDILEPGKMPAPVRHPDHETQFPCNKVGEPWQAWPTLVAHEQARGFKMEEGREGPGMVFDRLKGICEEPMALERELAMGLLAAATASVDVTERQRRRALGNAMGLNALHWLVGVMHWHLEKQRLERRRDHVAQAVPKTQQDEIKEEESEILLAHIGAGGLGGKANRGEAQVGGAAGAAGAEEGADLPNREEGTDQGAAAEGEGQGAGGGSETQHVWNIGEALQGTTTIRMGAVLRQHAAAFAHNLQELEKYVTGTMHLPLMSEIPVYQRRRRMSHQDIEVCIEKCQELLAAGLIRRSASDYAAATVVAAMTYLAGAVLSRRMCGDYRGLNKVMATDRYPMPMAEEIFDQLQGSWVFSTLDLRQGFNQIPIAEENKRKTAFHGLDGLYEWNYMLFGLRNASAVFGLRTKVAHAGATLHPFNTWILDSGAAWTMTPRAELLDKVGTAPIAEVKSASGHARKVMGAGRAIFKGADGKPVVLSDVLLVLDLKANLISLRKLAKCGVSTSTEGAKTFTGQLGKRVLWDLHESRDICKPIWQLPVMSWGKEGGSQGECNSIAAEELKVSARGGEKDWMTAHRRLGHIAMPALQQLQKEGVKGLKLTGAVVSHNCETCMPSKFTCLPFHATKGVSKKLLELVDMDVVGLLLVLVKRGIAERANRTVLETARALLIESGLGNPKWPHAMRHATVVKNWVFTNIGGESWVPMERWLGRKPPIDMLRVFGCMAMAHIPKAHRSKLGAKAAWCVHLGLAAESKGWLLWELSKGVVLDSRDVKFMEDITYSSWSKQPKEKLMQQLQQTTMGFDAEEWVGKEGATALEEEGAAELPLVEGVKPTVAHGEPHPITRVIPPTLPPK
ncbi:unnamed protein product [Closterium sp. NIES-54]